MKTKQVDIAELSADPANVRKHSEQNIEAIKGSLKRFGQQTPIVVDAKGVVRKGNGTLEAAKALGWKKIDVTHTELEGTEATAYSIADNRTGDSEVGSTWADELAVTLEELKGDGGLEGLGFSDADLANMTGGGEVPRFQPEPPDSMGRLDVVSRIVCPHCNKEFVPE